MKVCFLAGTLGRGGAERQLIFMLRALKDEGVQTRVLCLTSGEALEAEIRDLGIEIEWVGSSPGRLAKLLRIIRVIRMYRPDVIQSSHFYTNIYASLAGLVLRIPSIGAVRSDLTSEISADRVFGRWQAYLPDHLITNSELALRRALERGLERSRIHLVRNRVDQHNGCVRQSSADDKISILFVGRLGKEKRPQLFIKLAKEITERYPKANLSFRIVGDGPLRVELEGLRTRLGLSEDVLIFSGERTDVSEIYRNSNMLILTSEYEGTPNVVLEAMAHGLPVVSTRVGGVPDILPDGAGLLVDPSDFSGLVDATKRLILDPELRVAMGKKAKAAISERHSHDDLGRRLKEIYERLR
ncbi:MAG: glycosyltransferase [Pyrinomonadaceae bacterium]